MCKNVVCIFCANEGPQTDPFLGYSMYISDMDFLCSSVNIIVNNKNKLLWEIYPIRHKKLLDEKW